MNAAVRTILSLLLLGSAMDPAFPQDALTGPRRDITVLLTEYRQTPGTAFREREFNAVYQQAKQQNDILAIALLHNFRGGIYEKNNEMQQALLQYEHGLRELGLLDQQSDSTSELRQSKSTAVSSGNSQLADLYQGTVADLPDFFALPEKHAKVLISIYLLINNGNSYLQQSQFKSAETRYRYALDLAKSIREKRLVEAVYVNLAWSSIRRNRPDEAMQRLKPGGSDSVTSGAAPARLLLLLGTISRERGNLPQAKEYLQRAISAGDPGANNRWLSKAYVQLAASFYEENATGKAVEAYQQAQQLNETLQDAEVALHVSGGLALCFQAQADYLRSLDYFKVFLSKAQQLAYSFSTDEGRVSFLEDKDQLMRAYVRAALQAAKQQGDFTIAREVVERVRDITLNTLLRAGSLADRRENGHLDINYVAPGSRVPSLFEVQPMPNDAAIDVRQQAAGVEMVPAPPLSSFPQQTAVGIESGSMVETADGNERDSPMKPEAGMEEAPLPEVSFLEYFVLPEQLVIAVRSAAGAVHGAVVDIGESALEEQIAAFRKQLGVGDPRGVEVVYPASSGEVVTPPVMDLYDLLIKPVAGFLPDDSAKQLVIVPDRSLWQLPFAALKGEEGYLFEQHLLLYATSFASWQVIAARERLYNHLNASAWIAGNPQMPARLEACGEVFVFSALPGAEEESKKIAALFGEARARLFLGPEADRMRLEAWHQNVGVLHLATHGMVCPGDPFGSLVVLADLLPDQMDLSTAGQLSLLSDQRFPISLDGWEEGVAVAFSGFPGSLTARAIISRFRLSCDLVTMSACQTGLGQALGQGNIGFSRAFLVAGARSLLVSLWSVSDNATGQLMVHFYRAYLRHGNKALALRQAMSGVRGQSAYRAPKYWAPFTLVGVAE